MIPLSASSILAMSCLEVGSVVLVVAELVAVVTIYLAEVSPRRLHGDATSDKFNDWGGGGIVTYLSPF